jgi:hypothetical protein
MTAPATLAVEVTADDIANGEPQKNCLCPVALAIKRLPGVTDAWVEFDFAAVTFEDGERNYALPPEADAFIHAFDGGEPVGPLAFTAKLEDEEES